MLIIYSHSQVPIRLTRERWRHIVSRHPEMADKQDLVVQTLAEPDLVQDGDFGALMAIRWYPELIDGGAFVVMVYREVSESDGFVITTYLTRRPSERRSIVWKR
ncbi:hypothetical protein JXA88_06720 [Candidatus Fermentibacteria bacterium]|nr:hypothetical protein [Candidatus Fermentibacteria bacterium]